MTYEELLLQAPAHDSPEFITFLEDNNEVVLKTENWLVVKNVKYHTEEKPWLTAFHIEGKLDVSVLDTHFNDWRWEKKPLTRRTISRFHIHLTHED